MGENATIVDDSTDRRVHGYDVHGLQRPRTIVSTDPYPGVDDSAD